MSHVVFFLQQSQEKELGFFHTLWEFYELVSNCYNWASWISSQQQYKSLLQDIQIEVC